LAYHVETLSGRASTLISKQPLYEAYREYSIGIEEFLDFDYAQSMKHFERAIELDPEFMCPQLGLATIYNNQGRKAKADLLFQQINLNRERLSQYEKHGLDFMKAGYIDGRPDKALEAIRQAEKLNPKSIVDNFLLGQFALMRNYPWETIEIQNKIEPESYEAWFMTFWGRNWFRQMIRAFHRLGNYKQALREVKRAQEYYPNDLRLLLDKAKALVALNRIEEVKEVIEDSLLITSRTGDQGQIMLAASRELRIYGHTEDAQELADQAVRWYRDLSSEEEAGEALQENLALALFEAGDLDESSALFKTLSAGNPENIEYIGYLGVIAAMKGDREEAQRISDKLQEIDRPYILGRHTYWRACIAANLNDKEKAVKLLSEAFSKGCSYTNILYNDKSFDPLRDYKPFIDLLKPKR
ncbi:MAG: tetratricopeptide repeat protein, partial [Candidatus Aminicenantes bacterium]|nr:tetratricopeptide repeat protein [Candidatus Aminicenantes bacterium]